MCHSYLGLLHKPLPQIRVTRWLQWDYPCWITSQQPNYVHHKWDFQTGPQLLIMTASSKAKQSSHSFVELENEGLTLATLASFICWHWAHIKAARRAHSRHTETQQWMQGTSTVLPPACYQAYDAQARLETNEAQQMPNWMRCILAYQ